MQRPNNLNRIAIESVLGQTFTDFEFIIVDDGSIDGLHSILLEYQQSDPRIMLLRHEVNCGLHAARINEGLLLAKGKYIAYMFEDDRWYPDALEALVNEIEMSRAPCLVYGSVDWEIYRPNGEVEKKVLGDWDFNYSILRNSNKLPNCGVLHHRELLQDCGLYDPHILARRLCDYDLWLRMGKKYQIKKCDHRIGKVVSGTKHSLTSIVPHDLVVTFRHMSTDRDHELRPHSIEEYEIDSLDWASDSLERYQIRERHIIQFWNSYPHLLSKEERNLSRVNRYRANRIVLTKADYSTSIDVTMGNYDQVLSSNEQTLVFVEERNLGSVTPEMFDTLILYRTIGQQSHSMAKVAREAQKSLIYMMDDNMLKFGTGYLADEFHYLKPGSVGLKILKREIEIADLIVSYSRQISEDCSPYNPRILELNTTIQHDIIQEVVPPEGGKSTGRRLKYAIITGSARDKELRTLWKSFEKFSRNHSGEIEFHVWGIDYSKYGVLDCPAFHRPFDHSYQRYLQAMKAEQFDYILMPLFDDHDTKKSKNHIKYLEITLAGAVGIYSRAEAYKNVVEGITGLKTDDSEEAWLEILEDSFNISDRDRREIHARAKAHILQEFTTEANILRYLSVMEAADLHSWLKSHTSPTGRAKIAYFFHESISGGGTLHLLRHAQFAKQFGFEPILCFRINQPLDPDMETRARKQGIDLVQLDFYSTGYWRSPSQEDSIRSKKLQEWLEQNDIRLIHMIIHAADVALAAKNTKIPVVATFHSYTPPPNQNPGYIPRGKNGSGISIIHSSSNQFARIWGRKLKTPAYCLRAPIGDRYFAEFETRSRNEKNNPSTVVLSGTLQRRKGQLEAIQAVGSLRDQGMIVKLIIMGYDHLRPEYVARCHHQIEIHNLNDQVEIRGFESNPDEVYAAADYLLCASTIESFPQTILKAMASGLRVISTPAGGIRELLRDGFCGVVTDGFKVEDIARGIKRALELPDAQWQQMLLNAHLSARMVAMDDIVAYKLLNLYNQAVHIKGSEYESRERDMGHSGEYGAQKPALKQVEIEPLSEKMWTELDGVVPHLPRRIHTRKLYHTVNAVWDHWSGVRIALATYEKSLSGSVNLQILTSKRGPAVRSVRFDLAEVKDGMPFEIFFDPIVNSKDRQFHLQWEILLDHPGLRLAIYEYTHRSNLITRIVNKISPQGGKLFGDMMYGLFS
jgi:glycosyltransferase involved in cell wall biosynthesis